jgi:hypothetical protein
MSNQNDYDISQVQVPESFLKQILENTTPLEEGEEEVHTQVPQTEVSQGPEVAQLLSLLFEEFDKLNKRFDSLQASINEITTAGSMGTYQKFGLGKKERVQKTAKNPECEAQAELEGRKSSRNTLAALLAKRIR